MFECFRFVCGIMPQTSLHTSTHTDIQLTKHTANNTLDNISPDINFKKKKKIMF